MRNPNLELLQYFDKANNVTPPTPQGAVQFGEPKPWSAEGDWRNTEITVTGDVRNGYVGTQTFHYRRIDLGQLFKDTRPKITLDVGSDSIPVAAALSAVYANLDISFTDIVLEPIEASAPSYIMKAHTSSLTFVGEVTVDIQWVGALNIDSNTPSGNLPDRTLAESNLVGAIS